MQSEAGIFSQFVFFHKQVAKFFEVQRELFMVNKPDMTMQIFGIEKLKENIIEKLLL